MDLNGPSSKKGKECFFKLEEIKKECATGRVGVGERLIYVDGLGFGILIMSSL